MHAARIALKRTFGAAAMLQTASLRIGAHRAPGCLGRQFSSPAPVANEQVELCVRAENVDFVREAICRMLNKQEESDLKPISDEQLEGKLNAFVSLYNEAHACISDCEEAKADLISFAEEFETAQKAVDNVFSCYTDLLDDFRRASDEQLKNLCQERLALAHRLKSLREELRDLTESE